MLSDILRGFRRAPPPPETPAVEDRVVPQVLDEFARVLTPEREEALRQSIIKAREEHEREVATCFGMLDQAPQLAVDSVARSVERLSTYEASVARRWGITVPLDARKDVRQ